jgi:hypothetical protein
MKISVTGQLCLILLALMLTISCYASICQAGEKWPGVDEAVIEKIAKEHGREAKEPFLNTDQGDLLLFVFLISGAVGGFAAGYYWRALIERKVADKSVKERVDGTVL